MTQAEVARKAGISERAYNVHERGKGGACRAKTQGVIADALGTKPSVLFGSDGRAR